MKVTVTVEKIARGKKIKRTATVEIPDLTMMGSSSGEVDFQQEEIRKTTETLLEALNGQ